MMGPLGDPTLFEQMSLIELRKMKSDTIIKLAYDYVIYNSNFPRVNTWSLNEMIIFARNVRFSILSPLLRGNIRFIQDYNVHHVLVPHEDQEEWSLVKVH